MPKCKECKSFQGRCDACFIVEGITTIKEVVFCEDCSAYICLSCQNNWFKRGVAYFLTKLGVKKVQQPEVSGPIIENHLDETESVIIKSADEIATVEFIEDKKESIDFQSDEPSLEHPDDLYS
jgi:hypothetical protein